MKIQESPATRAANKIGDDLDEIGEGPLGVRATNFALGGRLLLFLLLAVVIWIRFSHDE